MLSAQGSAGVAPEVNLRIPLHAGKGSHPGFKTQGRHHQKSKQRYQWPYKRTYVLQFFFKNKNKKK